MAAPVRLLSIASNPDEQRTASRPRGFGDSIGAGGSCLPGKPAAPLQPMFFSFVTRPRCLVRLLVSHVHRERGFGRSLLHSRGMGDRNGHRYEPEPSSLVCDQEARRMDWNSPRFMGVAGFESFRCLFLPDQVVFDWRTHSRADHGTVSCAGPDLWSGLLPLRCVRVGAVFVLIYNYVRDVRKSSGAEHAELAFISIGAISTLTLSILVAAILPLFIPRSQIVWFAPFRVILFSLVISYGIATRKIMEVGFFIRRAMSYFVLTAYLLALYGLTWWLVAIAFAPVFGGRSHGLAHVCAAIVVAFAMAPARGISQSLSDRLFVGTRRLDFRATMRKAADILKSVTTVSDLLERFGTTTAEAMGTERVLIFMLDRNSYVQRYPDGERVGGTSRFVATDPVIQHVAIHPEPLVLEELHRVRQTPAIGMVIDHMKELKAAAVLGIFSREGLAGIMLLGPRSSGRIYGSTTKRAASVMWTTGGRVGERSALHGSAKCQDL